LANNMAHPLQVARVNAALDFGGLLLEEEFALQ
jgi:hypothetical protein